MASHHPHEHGTHRCTQDLNLTEYLLHELRERSPQNCVVEGIVALEVYLHALARHLEAYKALIFSLAI